MILPAELQALDDRLLALAHGQPGALVPLFVALTVIGGGWGLVALVPFLARQTTRAATAWLCAAVVTQSALVSSLKALIGRVRPCEACAWCAPLGVACPGGGSFPSGHAAGSFAFAAFVATRAPRWALPAFAWAALVAWSRCVLGVHYPTDILAGAILGSGVGFAFARVSLRARAQAAVRAAPDTD